VSVTVAHSTRPEESPKRIAIAEPVSLKFKLFVLTIPNSNAAKLCCFSATAGADMLRHSGF
jgi:hypothetical protein